MVKKERLAAKATVWVALFSGRVSMLMFVIFLFVGPFELVQLELTTTGALVWNGMLSFLFFVQHSIMIRRSFRTRLSRIIASHYHGAIFSIASSLVLAVLILFWQSSNVLLLELQGPARWIGRSVFFMAMAGILWGGTALKGFDPFGKVALAAYLNGTRPDPSPFRVTGPYLWVRHPLYFFILLMIWSYPDLTADRLLFNLAWTAWIYIGTRLEEKDLVSDFGGNYRHYQQKVPMLIPWKGIASKKYFDVPNSN